MIAPRAKAVVSLLALSVALAGCITLFPKTSPAQLYRFGDRAPAAKADATAQPFGVLGSQPAFTQAAAGDRILTVTGGEAAYISDARWISPAAVLFEEAETRAFEAAGGPARLARRGDVASTSLTLRLNVETFEVDYAGPGGRAPTVVVQVRGELIRNADRQLVADRTFESHAPAGANRVGAIVKAFDTATADVLGQIVGWTETQGGSR